MSQALHLQVSAPAWRLVVAASALGGYALATTQVGGDWHALSNLASLVSGVAYVVLAVLAVVAPRVEATLLRGALAVLLVLVAGSYLFLLDADYRFSYSLLEHAITPALVVVDYVCVCRGPLRWWHPVAGLTLPLAYLGLYRQYDLRLYSFLDPARSNYPWIVLGFLASALLIGLVLMKLAVVCSGRGHQHPPARC